MGQVSSGWGICSGKTLRRDLFTNQFTKNAVIPKIPVCVTTWWQKEEKSSGVTAWGKNQSSVCIWYTLDNVKPGVWGVLSLFCLSLASSSFTYKIFVYQIKVIFVIN